MSSTTSKRLRRVWSIVDSAAETGNVTVSIAYLTAALEGGERWAKLEALAAEAPLPPDEWSPEWNTEADTKAEYERWYDQEMDRLHAEQDKILNAPDARIITNARLLEANLNGTGLGPVTVVNAPDVVL